MYLYCTYIMIPRRVKVTTVLPVLKCSFTDIFLTVMRDGMGAKREKINFRHTSTIGQVHSPMADSGALLR